MDYIQKIQRLKQLTLLSMQVLVLSFYWISKLYIHYKIDSKLESIPASDISAVPARQRGLSWRLDSSLYTWFLSPVVLNPQASWFSIKIECLHFFKQKLSRVMTEAAFGPNTQSVFISKHL